MQRRRVSGSLGILPVVIIILGLVLMGIGTVLLLRAQSRGGVSQVTPTVSEAGGGEPTYPEIERVSLADAKKAYDDGTAVFVDVRSASSYADSHITGSVNIPLSEINTRKGELDPNKWIITYCT